jgi:oligoendopeptidase F
MTTTINNQVSRQAVPVEQTWDLSSLFSNWQDWETCLASLPTPQSLASLLQDTYIGRIDQAPVLLDFIVYRMGLSRKLENLYVYAGLKQTEDGTNPTAQQYSQKVEILYSLLEAEFAFFEPELLACSNAALAALLQDPVLQDYRFYLEELVRGKPHVLSKDKEETLSLLSPVLGSFGTIHHQWNDVDQTFPTVTDSNGMEQPLSHARISKLMESKDRVLRQRAFEAYYGRIAEYKNTIASTYYAHIQTNSIMSRMRGYSSTLQGALFGTNIPESLYANLVQGVKDKIGLFHESLAIRKNRLGLDTLEAWDKYVPLSVDELPEFSWEEGRDTVLAAIAPLGTDYVEKARRGLTVDRWVDRAENAGKRSGAFSWGTYDSNPFMLQTWTNTLNDVYTLAHELGHSMHSLYSRTTQPYQYGQYTIFVAEVASTFNEILLTHHLRKHPNPTVRFEVVSQAIENFEGTILRQTMFADFEWQCSKAVDAGEPLATSDFRDIYQNLLETWYGTKTENTQSDTGNTTTKHYNIHGLEGDSWIRIPHFYSSFYVYKYATSFITSIALYQRYLTLGDAAITQYFSLLKAGGSKPSLEILKDAGVDLLDPATFESAFVYYGNLLQELRGL